MVGVLISRALHMTYVCISVYGCGFCRNYEDLACPAADAVISNRLNNGELVTLPYGKLMERLLLFRKMRQNNRASGTQAMEAAPFYHKLLPFAENMLKGIR